MELELVNQIADTTTLLSYISNLCLVFIIAIAGALTREIYNYKKKNTQISVARLIVSALLCSVIMTAVAEFITELKFGVFTLITYFFGMWAFSVIDIIMNAKYIAIAIKDVFKELKNPLLKGTANAIEDIRKEIKEENKDKDKKNNSTNNKKPSDEDEKKEENKTPPDPPEQEDMELLDKELLEQIRKLERRVEEEIKANKESAS